MRMFLAAAALLAAVAGCGGDTARQRGDLLVVGARLFDGIGMRTPGAVLMRGSQIVAVGTTVDADATRRIDVGDATIMPGFIDLHVHAISPVTTGVTTVRDLGLPLRYLRPPEVNRGVRILLAGPIMTVAGGYPTPVWGHQLALDVESPEDAKRKVDLLVRRGSAVIKIALEPGLGVDWPMLSLAEVRAIVDEAHRHHLHVVAHAFREGLARALAGGVDELAHTPCGATRGQAQWIGRRRIPVDATLHVEAAGMHGSCVGVAQQIVQAGGVLLYGTDVGNQGIPYGVDVEELNLMHLAGMPPLDVLAAATSKAGADVGVPKLGTLAAGAPADVIAVRGDARLLRYSLADPVLVVSGGAVRRGG
jgi:imidazolonepropionase-like amidohydrolase